MWDAYECRETARGALSALGGWSGIIKCKATGTG